MIARIRRVRSGSQPAGAGLAWIAVALALSANAAGVAYAKKPQPAADAEKTAQPVGPADVLTETAVVAHVTAAIDKALAYLSSKQRPDGSWTDSQAGNALTILAFLGRGHVPGRGMYPELLERGKRNILVSQQPNGVLGKHSRMYEHALATLACAELYGMDPDPELEDTLRKAIDLIVKAQSPSGGWRYNPKPGDQDLSVTVMQIVALHAANNAEIPVPAETIDKAVKYVVSCAAPNGGFSYTAGAGPGPQMSAAGVLSLQLLGHYDDPVIAKALDYLSKIPVKWANSKLRYFYYFHYYSIQGHYQAGGRFWNDWHPQVRELLLANQNADGSWDLPPGSGESEGVVGLNKIYWTAMATLVLEIYMHFLPAYQR